MDALIDRVLASDELLAALITVFFALSLAVGQAVLTARPRIRWAYSNLDHLRWKTEPPAENPENLPAVWTSILVGAFTVENVGRRTANKIEVILNWCPGHLEWFPHIPCTRSNNPDGRHVLEFHHLNPKETVYLYMMSINQSLPEITYVRYDGGGAKKIKMKQVVDQPTWANVLILMLFASGLTSWIYVIVRLAI